MPPTYSFEPSIRADWDRLDAVNKERFRKARDQLLADLVSGTTPRPGLRVKGVKGRPGVYEMTWAPDGRATFEFGAEVKPGNPHILWRRIGTHSIFNRP